LPLIESILALLDDDHPRVAACAVKAIDGIDLMPSANSGISRRSNLCCLVNILLVSAHGHWHLSLQRTLEERAVEVLITLPAVARRENQRRIRAALSLAAGYVRFLHNGDKLQPMFDIQQHRLVSSLCDLVQIDASQESGVLNHSSPIPARSENMAPDSAKSSGR
jgi:hypothetical protein